MSKTYVAVTKACEGFKGECFLYEETNLLEVFRPQLSAQSTPDRVRAGLGDGGKYKAVLVGYDQTILYSLSADILLRVQALANLKSPLRSCPAGALS